MGRAATTGGPACHVKDAMTPEPAPPTQTAHPLKIFQWSASLEDGTWMYRLRTPGDALRRLGHEVQASTQIGMWARDDADVVIGQRICQVKPATLWVMLCDALRERGAVSVYEVDDDLFSIESRTNPLGRPFRHPEVQATMRACIRAADLVTVSTEPLADVMRGVRGPGRDPDTVRVLPNCLPPEAYEVRRARPPSAWTTLYGWQGSNTHDADWAVARDAVVTVLTEDAPTRMRFLGTAHPEGLPRRKRVETYGWTTDLRKHYERVADFDVTLAPLARTTFNRSKSGLRVIESLGLGVPVVASDVPAYRPWLTDGVTGFFARSTGQWADAMRKLQDPARRADMGAAGREAAKAWAIDANVWRWEAAYRPSS